MKLAVSNIAWRRSEQNAAYALLQVHGIRGLEIAPSLFFEGAIDAFAPTEEDADRALTAMRRAGLELVSMQSLLFEAKNAALFGSATARDNFHAAMLRAIDLAGRFSIPNLVFGAPRQRNVPQEMSMKEAEGIAIATFRRLGDAAGRAGTKLGIEFNPAAYGTNFLNEVDEAMAFVERVDNPAVSLILDAGAMHMNGDFSRIDTIAADYSRCISHVHVSEPNLEPAPASTLQAAQILTAMTKAGYSGWYSIEMKQQPDLGLGSLDAALHRLRESVKLVEKKVGST